MLFRGKHNTVQRAVVTNQSITKPAYPGGPREQIKCIKGLPLSNRLAQMIVSAVTSQALKKAKAKLIL